MPALFNQLLNNLPFEAHFKNYHFCVPEVKLKKKLTSRNKGMNELDNLYKDHDIKNSWNSNNLKARRETDSNLAKKAWLCVLAKN